MYGFANILLEGISKLEFPISETMTAYHEIFDFGEAPAGAGGAYFLIGVRDVKVSFADFDFYANGTKYGCSGHTAALPICVRMWIDDERYLAWVFDSYPYFDDLNTEEIDDGPGQGKFKIFYFNVMELFIGADLYARTDYDFEVEEYKRGDLSIRIYKPEDPDYGIDIYDVRWRTRTIESGPAATALKQIAIYQAEVLKLGPDSGVANYMAQYREGYDLWSGSVLCVPESSLLPNIDDQCAYITSAEEAPEGECADVGGIDIRVGGIPFLDPLDLADVSIPSDFPLEPPKELFP